MTALSHALRRNASGLAATAAGAARGDVRAIHRLRVATRRLRGALPAAAQLAGLASGDADAIGRDLRRLGKGFGPVRELDVARAVLADFADREDWPSAVVVRVDEYCGRLRDRAFEDAKEIIDGIDARKLRRRVSDLAGALDHSRATGQRMTVAFAVRVREAARALAREIEGAGTLYTPPALHEIRICAKKLRYVLEIAGETVPGSGRRLRALQTALGQMHDAQILQHRIQELAATVKDRGVVSTLTSMDHAIEAVCRGRHAKVLKTLPDMRQLCEALIAEAPAAIRPRQFGRPARMASAEARPRRRRIA